MRLWMVMARGAQSLYLRNGYCNLSAFLYTNSRLVENETAQVRVSCVSSSAILFLFFVVRLLFVIFFVKWKSVFPLKSSLLYSFMSAGTQTSNSLDVFWFCRSRSRERWWTSFGLFWVSSCTFLSSRTKITFCYV